MAPGKEVDDFLSRLPEGARDTLEKVRTTIRSAVPDAVEAISYGVPTFKYRGRPLVGFGAARNHCALYVMSPEVMEAHAADLEGYDTSKGTIRFPAGMALPAALVKKLVEARIAENEASGSGYR